MCIPFVPRGSGQPIQASLAWGSGPATGSSGSSPQRGSAKRVGQAVSSAMQPAVLAASPKVKDTGPRGGDTAEKGLELWHTSNSVPTPRHP